MTSGNSQDVDVFMRVGSNDELHLATVRDPQSMSELLHALAAEIERLNGSPATTSEMPKDFYADETA